MKIGLAIKDFEYGTKISCVLAVKEYEIQFIENHYTRNIEELSDYQVIIINFDEQEFGNVHFVSTIKQYNKSVKIYGFLKYMHKTTVEKLKSAGVDLILSKTSFIKNVINLIED